MAVTLDRDNTEDGRLILPDEAKICIVRLSALGDVIHVLPALEALRRRYPAARFSWVTEELAAPLLEEHPDLERVWTLPRKQWQKQLKNPARLLSVARGAFRFFRSLRRERFRVALDFQANLRGAIVARLSGAASSAGFHRSNCREGSSVLHQLHAAPVAPTAHRTERNLALTRVLGFQGVEPRPRLPAYAHERAQARAWLGSTRPVFLLHPGVSAFGSLKAWTEEGFAELAEKLSPSPGAQIVLTWSAADSELVDRIIHRTAAPVRKAPPCSTIRDLAGLIAEADMLIAPDTGVLHLANALGTAVVGLFGPKDPAVYGPRRAPRKVVRSGVDCSPCSRRRCDHRSCMRSITADMVAAAVTDLLGEMA